MTNKAAAGLAEGPPPLVRKTLAAGQTLSDGCCHAALSGSGPVLDL